jgi:hypothetical protein
LVGTLVVFVARKSSLRPDQRFLLGFAWLFIESFWCSLDLFLPAVELRSADTWALPLESGLWVKLGETWMRFHVISGWILIPIGLLSVTGIFK